MIAIIDYNSGNLASVVNALKKLKVSYTVTSDPRVIAKADKVIFPGQGRAGQAIKELKKRGIFKIIPKLRVPFLGICIGMQLLSEFSYEDNIACLGIISRKVQKLPSTIKIPQIGWNMVKFVGDSPILKGIPNKSYFYFVNSYYFNAPNEYTIGETDYGITFPAVVQKNNFYATQFHPEKSGKVGEKLLRNFIEKC